MGASQALERLRHHGHQLSAISHNPPLHSHQEMTLLLKINLEKNTNLEIIAFLFFMKYCVRIYNIEIVFILYSIPKVLLRLHVNN